MPRRNFRYLYKDEIIPSATELKGISELYDLYTVKATGKPYPVGFYITGSNLDSGVAARGNAYAARIDAVGYHVERTFTVIIIPIGDTNSDDLINVTPVNTLVSTNSTGILTNISLGTIAIVRSTAEIGRTFIVRVETAEEGILYEKTMTII